MEPIMNARQLETALQAILYEIARMDNDDRAAADLWDAEPLEGARVTTFEDSFLMVRDRGLVIRLTNGAEFQVTIVQSERPPVADEDNEPRYAPNSLTPGGWPTDEDGFERFGE